MRQGGRTAAPLPPRTSASTRGVGRHAWHFADTANGALVCPHQRILCRRRTTPPSRQDLPRQTPGLPRRRPAPCQPDYHLGVGSGSHAAQTAHVEAGLRSGDRGMPEELNRLLTDQLANLLFTTERGAGENLAREGIDAAKVDFVGNTMIDTLERLLPQARGGEALERLRLTAHDYGLVTVHRPSNVDDAGRLEALVEALRRTTERVPLVWPVHPRTRARLDELQQAGSGSADPRLVLTEPLGYLDFLQLMDGARLVLTDSGGIQEETTVLGVPCLTLRTTTERPVTVTEGTNRLVDPCDAAAIVGAVDDVLAAPMPQAHRPELWDGHAAERIVAVIADWAASRLPSDGT